MDFKKYGFPKYWFQQFLQYIFLSAFSNFSKIGSVFIANVSLSKHSVVLLEQLLCSRALQIDKPTTYGYHQCI